MALIYLAHPYAAETEAKMQGNRRSAMAWGIWIARTFGVAVSADWIWWCEYLTETPENHELGLRCDDQAIMKCDEFWMVGGRISGGMLRGERVARGINIAVRDLTGWGVVPPKDAETARVGGIYSIYAQTLKLRSTLIEKGLISR